MKCPRLCIFYTSRLCILFIRFFFFLRFCKRSAILQPDCLRVRSPTLYSPTSLQARHRVCFSKFSFYNLFAFCNGILNLSLDTLVNSRWQACDVTLLDIIYLLLPREFEVTKVRNCTKIIGTRKYNNLFSYGSNDSRDRHQGILLQITTYLSFLNSSSPFEYLYVNHNKTLDRIEFNSKIKPYLQFFSLKAP